MITLIEGSTGAGKTLLMSRLTRKEWKQGRKIYPNFPMWFDEAATDVTRWHVLDDTFNLENGIICIDESQKLLNNRRWQSLPQAFIDKIAMHRHHHVDIITTTQDFGHVDNKLRDNIHVRYRCQNIFRFPRNERRRPIFQIITASKYNRVFEGNSMRPLWIKSKIPHFMFVSKYWTKTYYNTYGEVGQEKFICRAKFQKKNQKMGGVWRVRIINRHLVESNRKRL